MRLKSNTLRDAISFALACAMAGLSTATLAEPQQTQTSAPASETAPDTADTEAKQLDTVTVTGTRIQSQTVTATSPVTEISKQEFQYGGATKVEDMVNQFPQLSPAFDAWTNNDSTGYPTVDLRGMGARRTLTLVNGFRLPPGAQESADISIVPSAAIRKVDLLTGGASAAYGSDAIAGVVNFILDDQFEGVHLSAGLQGYQHDNDNRYIQRLMDEAGYPYPKGNSGFDGRSHNIDLLLGSRFADDRGHAMVWATWRKNDPLLQAERDYSACALDSSGEQCGGSGTNASGNFTIAQQQIDPDHPDPDDPEHIRHVNALASLNPDGSWQAAFGTPYNYAPVNYFQRPDQRHTFGAHIEYEINPHFRPYLDAMFIDKQDRVQIAPSGTFFLPLTFDDCTAPQLGTLCQDLAAQGVALDPALPLTVNVGRRNIEGGPRRTHSQTSQWRVVTGLEGDLDHAWQYNLAFMHARMEYDTYGYNDLLADRTRSALLGCPDGSFDGCIPYDVWRPNAVTVDAALALAGVSATKNNSEMNNFIAYVTGDTGVALPWLDETISLAIGGEWRETTFQSQADSNSQAGNFTGAGGPSLPVAGKTQVTEVYLESAVPLATELGAMKSLGLELGWRKSDYKLTGSTNAVKLGLSANFTDLLRLRASYSRSNRAPSVVELFSTTQISLFAGDDPCAGPSPSLSAEQCANTGVPVNRYGTIPESPASQSNQLVGGNPDLKPEQAKTFTFGVVYTPSPGSQFNLDYYDIRLADAIDEIGAATILQFCATTGVPFLCNRIHRSPSTLDIWLGSNPNTSGYVENLRANFGNQHFRGLDLGAHYGWDIWNGRMLASLNGSYKLKQEYDPLPGVERTAVYDCRGVINPSCQSTQKWRHIANLRYSNDRFSLNLRWRHFSKQAYRLEDGSRGEADVLLAQRGEIPAYNYLDLSGSLYLGEAVELTLGVNNIADKEPPMVGGVNGPSNANSIQGYDLGGRTLFGSVDIRF